MARSFNGSSDNIALGSVTGALDISGTTHITIACWINPTSNNPGANTLWDIVEKGFDGTNEQYSFTIQNDPNTGNVNALFFNSAPTLPAFWAYGASLPANAWSHVAAKWDGSTKSVWFNGVSKGTSSDSTSINHTAKQVHIGAADINGSVTRFFPGSIADVGIWNTDLTGAEISALANGARCYTIRPGNLKGYYPLDGLQSPEPDLSGNANNGTLTGTALAAGPPFMMFTPRWPQSPPGTFGTPGTWIPMGFAAMPNMVRRNTIIAGM